MKRLLVIGGGLAGLSAAWQARRAGAQVRLLEATDRIGGMVVPVRGIRLGMCLVDLRLGRRRRCLR